VGTSSAAVRDRDVSLARRASTGDRAAQRELFAAQRAAVHHTLFRILGSNRDIEDALQDAFVEIFRALPSFRGDSSLTRWCRTIATRVAFVVISKRRPSAVSLELVAEPPAAGADVGDAAFAREAARRLYAALGRMDAKLRIAFALVVIDGLSIAEVAELTDSSRVAVKTRVWRARRELVRRADKDAVLRTYLERAAGAGTGTETGTETKSDAEQDTEVTP
jgi:RNA polymerase sigma-70 factor (ECF subfamily)